MEKELFSKQISQGEKKEEEKTMRERKVQEMMNAMRREQFESRQKQVIPLKDQVSWAQADADPSFVQSIERELIHMSEQLDVWTKYAKEEMRKNPDEYKKQEGAKLDLIAKKTSEGFAINAEFFAIDKEGKRKTYPPRPGA